MSVQNFTTQSFFYLLHVSHVFPCLATSEHITHVLNISLSYIANYTALLQYKHGTYTADISCHINFALPFYNTKLNPTANPSIYVPTVHA